MGLVSPVEKAHLAVYQAVKDGTLERGPCDHRDSSPLPCRGRIEGHHDDYAKPLDVVWLCALHHRQLHMSRRREPAMAKFVDAVNELVTRGASDEEIAELFDLALKRAHRMAA